MLRLPLLLLLPCHDDIAFSLYLIHAMAAIVGHQPLAAGATAMIAFSLDAMLC